MLFRYSGYCFGAVNRSALTLPEVRHRLEVE